MWQCTHSRCTFAAAGANVQKRPSEANVSKRAHKLPGPGEAWRICLVSTDSRPLQPFGLNTSGEDPLLAATVNQQYAARHNYAYILSSYDPAALSGRAYGWSKVQVLRELMHTRPEVDAFAFLDGDASMNTHARLEPLLRSRFFDDAAKLFFFALDPPGLSHPVKWMSWTDPIDGRTWHNDHANTVQTCGFFVVKNTRRARGTSQRGVSVAARLQRPAFCCDLATVNPVTCMLGDMPGEKHGRARCLSSQKSLSSWSREY